MSWARDSIMHRFGKLICYSPDDSLLAIAFITKVWVLRSDERVLLHELEGHEYEVRSVAFSPDGQLLATGGVDKTVLWWMKDGGNAATIPVPADSVSFSPNGKYLASCGAENAVRIWEIGGGKITLAQMLETESSNISLEFDRRGDYLAVGSFPKENVRIWSTHTWKSTCSFTLNSSVQCIALHPDGNLIVVGCYDGPITIWDIPKSTLLHSYKGHERGTNCVAFTSDGRFLITCGDDRCINIWGMTTNSCILSHDMEKFRIFSIAPRRDMKYLAYRHSEGEWEEADLQAIIREYK